MLEKIRNLLYSEKVSSDAKELKSQADDSYDKAMQSVLTAKDKHKKMDKELNNLNQSGGDAIEEFLNGVRRLD